MDAILGFVVAISGVSGAGKSTLVQSVVERLGNAVPLCFDDYESVSTYPPDLERWVVAGGDPDCWRTPQFAGGLLALRHGKAIYLPDGRRVEPAPVIVVEEPFGRERAEMARLIDFVVLIETPLEIALMQKLQQHLAYLDVNRHIDALAHLRTYLNHYPTYRNVYRAVLQRVASNCDLRVDGQAPVDRSVDLIVQHIQAMYR